MILFLSKKMIKENYYIEIFYYGVSTLVKCTKEYYDNCKFVIGQKLNDDMFEISCYKKGYDNILSLKIK